MFVREADEAVCLGPATAVAATAPRSGYLDHAALERALVAARADAAWVGWGFVAEHPEFADLCERLGIVFVGPDAGGHAAGRRQDRRQAAGRGGRRAGRAVERRAGRHASRRRSRHATRIGFPLMVKAAAGGGGRGIRRVDAPDGAGRRLRSARAPRREQAFGDGTLLLERLVSARPARRGAGDRRRPRAPRGRSACATARCQRRNQKVIEESASPALDRRAGRRRSAMAARAARAARRLPQRRHGRVPLRARRRAASRSWRSTPACRSSTP